MMRVADTLFERLLIICHLDDFVLMGHQLRPIRKMDNAALVNMDELLCSLYEADIKRGRPSIAPEKLLRAMLRQIFNSVRCAPINDAAPAQLAVSLVHWPGYERYGVSAQRVQQKP